MYVCMYVSMYAWMSHDFVCVPLGIPFELQPICGAINHPADMSI